MATDELEKKTKEEGSGEKSVSLNEEKHDKSQDRKVEVEKTNDSPATVTWASGEDKKADAAVAEQQNNGDSPSLEACVEDNLEVLNSESPAISISVTETPETQSQEPLPTVGTREQNQPEAVKEIQILESQEKGHVEQPNINATPESDATVEAVKVTATSEAKPTGNPIETETQSVIPEIAVESTGKPGIPPQVSPHKEAQVANEAESSPGIAENIVQEEVKKEPSVQDETERVSKGSVGVFVNQEAKTDLQEEKKNFAVPSVEEKVAVIYDDRKERDARDVVEGLSREAHKVATPEEEQEKMESVKDDQPADISVKEEHAETKVDEITGAVSESVRETLASKFEEKEEDSITSVDKVNETVKEPVKMGDQITNPPTKETAAKPPHKQSNNILFKVKQSLLKAKKVITGKSSSSKTISSEIQGDIRVK